MLFLFYSLLVFYLIGCLEGKLTLQITKKTNDFIYPVHSVEVEEKVGTSFSLVCELVTSANESSLFDDQLSWLRGNENISRFQHRSMNEVPKQKPDIKEINKSEKRFDPLQTEDGGKYICISHKFNVKREVGIIVREEIRRREHKPMREPIYCSENMFQCLTSGICVIQHYVCDGKADCKDGSDESIEKCNGDPCKDKIPCDDGRCIPTAWCCDRHHDLNCTVTNTPNCCLGLSDSYEEMELGFPTVSETHHTTRYLFILVCVVSILFSVILLLLIVSRVAMFAKKTSIQQRHNLCENIALRNQTNINVIPCDIYSTYRNSRTPRNNIVRNIIIDSSDVNDPLLFDPARFNVINAASIYDQPPSYVDVLRNNRMVIEPPPPYVSQDALNSLVGCGDDRSSRSNWKIFFMMRK